MANETLMDAISRHRNVRNEPGSQHRGENERLFLDHNRLDAGAGAEAFMVRVSPAVVFTGSLGRD
jgi:hypothetical protein